MVAFNLSLINDPRVPELILSLEYHCPGDDLSCFLMPLLGNPYLKVV
jgi:hypothetical protein